MRRDHRLSVLSLATSILTIAFLGFQFLSFTEAKTNLVGFPSMSLAVVGADGTQVFLNETGIAELPSYNGYGGFKNQLGTVRGLGNYTGVPLSTLCGLVGNLTSTSVVKVVASDDYSSNLTLDQVSNGNFTTYDSNGDEVLHNQSLVPILAYHFNDVNITESSGGPLRLAMVGPEGLVTNSTYWVKWVVRIEVIDKTVPEFPSLVVMSSFLFANLAVALGFSALRRKQLNAKRIRKLTGERGR
jgi:DMSO/TMAO reductase YedYZ molybdopterin-dependent catalytic subunit